MSGEPEEQKDSVKITLIGSAGVGKTCIIRRYTQNTYDNNPTSKTGGSYSVKNITINNRNIQMDIWDTAGQERFRALGKHFYKDSYVVCLVYDITNQESLDSLKNIWYPDLQKYGEQYTILAVVGNKCDLYEMDNLAKEEQAKAFADEIKAIFMLTSAKTGDGIEKLFNTLTDKFLSPEFNPKVKEMIRKRGPSFSVDNEKNDKNFQKKCC